MIETENILKGQEKYLQDKIDKLNRKAVKIGCPMMVLTFGDDIVSNWTDEYGRKRTTVRVPATLEYEIPIIDGWKLISTFDIYTAQEKPKVSTTEVTIPEPEYKSVVMTSTVPGETLPTAYLNKTEIHCDHCGHNRYRTHSMLMQHVDTGEYKEVGSTCIRDFFGHDPVAFMRWASFSFTDTIGELPEEEAGFGGRGPLYEDLRETLIVSSGTIRKYGWLSKGKAYEQGREESCTAYEVCRQMDGKIWDKMEKEYRVYCDDEDVRIADEAIAYFAASTDQNDYMSNCRKLTEMGYVPYKHHNLAVSMIPSYNRAAAEQREAAEDTSEFVGSIGDKIKGIKADVIFKKELFSDFGSKTLYIFKDDAGNNYKTFYTGSKWEAFLDDEIELAGTIKSHDEYKGKKSTLLTRCSVEILVAPNGRETIEQVEAIA